MSVKKTIKKAALRAAQTVGASHLYRQMKPHDIRILCYHGAWMSPCAFPGDAMFIRPEVFARRLELIEQSGYRVVSLDDAVAALSGERAPIKNGVVVTIDDGWLSTYQTMAPELKKRGMPATLYCDTQNFQSGKVMAHLVAYYARSLAGPDAAVGENGEAAYRRATDVAASLDDRWSACQEFADAIGFDLAPLLEGDTFLYMSADNLRALAEFGVDVQLHTHTHSLGDFSADRVARELADNRRELAALLSRPGESFRHFCYPSGAYSLDALEHFRQGDVMSATTCESRLAGAADDLLLLPRILDNGAWSDVEFTSELAGVSSLIRRMASAPDARRPQIDA